MWLLVAGAMEKSRARKGDRESRGGVGCSHFKYSGQVKHCRRAELQAGRDLKEVREPVLKS